LEGAPGWRVIERPQTRSPTRLDHLQPRPEPRPKRRGRVLLPLAIFGVFAVLMLSHQYLVGSLADDGRRVAAVGSALRTIAPPPAASTPTPMAPPEPAVAEPEPAAPGIAEPSTEVTRLEPAVPEAAPAAAVPLRIFIHYPAGAGDAVPALQLAAFLQIHRFAVADIRLVDTEIERPTIRYFFAGDRPQSRRLADAINAFFADRSPYEVADFSHFSPKPRRGNVEVWLPGRPS